MTALFLLHKKLIWSTDYYSIFVITKNQYIYLTILWFCYAVFYIFTVLYSLEVQLCSISIFIPTKSYKMLLIISYAKSEGHLKTLTILSFFRWRLCEFWLYGLFKSSERYSSRVEAGYRHYLVRRCFLFVWFVY